MWAPSRYEEPIAVGARRRWNARSVSKPRMQGRIGNVLQDAPRREIKIGQRRNFFPRHPFTMGMASVPEVSRNRFTRARMPSQHWMPADAAAGKLQYEVLADAAAGNPDIRGTVSKTIGWRTSSQLRGGNRPDPDLSLKGGGFYVGI